MKKLSFATFLVATLNLLTLYLFGPKPILLAATIPNQIVLLGIIFKGGLYTKPYKAMLTPGTTVTSDWAMVSSYVVILLVTCYSEKGILVRIIPGMSYLFSISQLLLSFCLFVHFNRSKERLVQATT